MLDHAVDISVVLPIYNQADDVKGIVTGFAEALSPFKHGFELLLVVNGNKDGSLARCRAVASKHPEIRIIHLEISGWGRAVRTGLAESRGSVLCYTNTARTSPEALAQHITMALANPECAIKANRLMRHPFHRRVGSLIYNVECRCLFGLPAWDVNGTPKVFRREAYELFDLQEDGDLIDVEFVLNCMVNRIKILEVPIASRERRGGKSTTNLISALRMYWGALRMFRRFSSRLSETQGSSN
jgi:glycosyltransferase involved in cell wall biosynthesis